MIMKLYYREASPFSVERVRSAAEGAELANRMLRSRRIITPKSISARARFKEYTPCANPTFK
jgi:hypothetical protein